MPNIGFTIHHVASFPLGFADSRVIFILNPPGQCSSECWAILEPCAAPPRGNSRFGFSCMESSSECDLRTRSVHLLPGFVGTFGRCCWIGFDLSKLSCRTGIPCLIGMSREKVYPSLTVRACDGLSWDTLAGI